MELVLIALGSAGLIAAALGLRRHRRHAEAEREDAEAELAAVRHLAEADAVMFGEELARLDARVAGAELDEDARTHYQTALDAYESGLRVIDRLRSAGGVGDVVDTLAAGRYAVACVLASLEGTPLPRFRPPCFFDPRHGPATTEVMWHPRGQGTRKVPACSQDAARQSQGATVDVTTVQIGGVKMPYWATGAANRPYVHGFERQRHAHDRLNQVRALHETYNQGEQFGPY